MDALMGHEVCAPPLFGAFVMTAEEAITIRAALRNKADALLAAGNGRDAVPLAMLSKRLGEFVEDLNHDEHSFLEALRTAVVERVR